MKRLIKKVLALFSKPKEEIKLDPKKVEAWPFPVPKPKAKRKPVAKKATTVAKKATTVAKKATAKKVTVPKATTRPKKAK